MDSYKAKTGFPSRDHSSLVVPLENDLDQVTTDAEILMHDIRSSSQLVASTFDALISETQSLSSRLEDITSSLHGLHLCGNPPLADTMDTIYLNTPVPQSPDYSPGMMTTAFETDPLQNIPSRERRRLQRVGLQRRLKPIAPATPPPLESQLVEKHPLYYLSPDDARRKRWKGAGPNAQPKPLHRKSPKKSQSTPSKQVRNYKIQPDEPLSSMQGYEDLFVYDFEQELQDRPLDESHFCASQFLKSSRPLKKQYNYTQMLRSVVHDAEEVVEAPFKVVGKRRNKRKQERQGNTDNEENVAASEPVPEAQEEGETITGQATLDSSQNERVVQQTAVVESQEPTQEEAILHENTDVVDENLDLAMGTADVQGVDLPANLTLVKNFTWGSSSTVGTVLYSVYGIRGIIEAMTASGTTVPLKNFMYYRWHKLVFTLQPNGDPFAKGQIIMAWVPGADDDYNYKQLFGFPNALVTANHNQSVDLETPFVYHDLVACPRTDEVEMGKIVIAVVNATDASSAVNLSLFASFKNLKHRIPTEYHDITSTGLLTAEKIMKHMSSAELSILMKRMQASRAKQMNVTQSDPHSILTVTKSSQANSVLPAKQGNVSVPPQFKSMRGKMTLETLCRCHYLLDTFSWSNSTAQGTLLKAYSVFPPDNVTAGTLANGTTYDARIASNFIRILRMHDAARADIVWTIQVVSSHINRGKIMLVWLPNISVTEAATMTISEISTYTKKIFDISSGNTTQFLTPFQWKNSAIRYTEAVGTLAIYNLNSFISSSGSTSADINVIYHAQNTFFAIPKWTFASLFTNVDTGANDGNLIFSDTSLKYNETQSDPAPVPVRSTNVTSDSTSDAMEEITTPTVPEFNNQMSNLKAILEAWNYVGTYTLAANSIYYLRCDVTSCQHPNTQSNPTTPAVALAEMAAYWRGDIEFKFVSWASVDVTGIFVASFGLNPRSTEFETICSAHQVANLSTCKEVTIDAPAPPNHPLRRMALQKHPVVTNAQTVADFVSTNGVITFFQTSSAGVPFSLFRRVRPGFELIYEKNAPVDATNFVKSSGGLAPVEEESQEYNVTEHNPSFTYQHDGMSPKTPSFYVPDDSSDEEMDVDDSDDEPPESPLTTDQINFFLHGGQDSQLLSHVSMMLDLYQYECNIVRTHNGLQYSDPSISNAFLETLSIGEEEFLEQVLQELPGPLDSYNCVFIYRPFIDPEPELYNQTEMLRFASKSSETVDFLKTTLSKTADSIEELTPVVKSAAATLQVTSQDISDTIPQVKATLRSVQAASDNVTAVTDQAKETINTKVNPAMDKISASADSMKSMGDTITSFMNMLTENIESLYTSFLSKCTTAGKFVPDADTLFGLILDIYNAVTSKSIPSFINSVVSALLRLKLGARVLGKIYSLATGVLSRKSHEDNTTEFESLSGITGFVGTIIGAIVDPVKLTAASVTKFITFAGNFTFSLNKIDRSRETITKIFDWVKEHWEMFVAWWYDGEVVENLTLDKRIIAWLTDVQAINREDIPEKTLNDRHFCDQIIALRDRGNTLELEIAAANAKTSACLTFSRINKEIRELSETLIRNPARGLDRPNMFHILFVSPPGTGKSKLIPEVARVIGQMKGWPLGKGLMYHRNTMVDHHDDYRHQKIWINDEEYLSPEGEDIKEAVPMISNNAYQLKQAAIPNKGMYLSSEIMIGATNTPFPKCSDVVRDQDAVYRRRHAMYQLVIHPDFLDGNVIRFDKVKKNWEHVYFNVYDDPTNPMVLPRYLGDVQAMINDLWQKYVNFDALNDIDPTKLSLPLPNIDAQPVLVSAPVPQATVKASTAHMAPIVFQGNPLPFGPPLPPVTPRFEGILSDEMQQELDEIENDIDSWGDTFLDSIDQDDLSHLGAAALPLDSDLNETQMFARLRNRKKNTTIDDDYLALVNDTFVSDDFDPKRFDVLPAHLLSVPGKTLAVLQASGLDPESVWDCEPFMTALQPYEDHIELKEYNPVMDHYISLFEKCEFSVQKYLFVSYMRGGIFGNLRATITKLKASLKSTWDGIKAKLLSADFWILSATVISLAAFAYMCIAVVVQDTYYSEAYDHPNVKPQPVYKMLDRETNYTQHSRDPMLVEIKKGFVDRVVEINTKAGRIHGLAIGNRAILMNYHVFYNAVEGDPISLKVGNTTVSTTFSKDRFHKIAEDLGIFVAGRRMRQFSSIAHHFFTDADLLHRRRFDGALYTREGSEMETRYMPVTRLDDQKYKCSSTGAFYVAPLIFKYDFHSPGVCGSPLFCVDPSNPRKVMGIHTAGGPHGGWSVPVTQEMLRPYENLYRERHALVVPETESDLSLLKVAPVGNYEVVGVAKKGEECYSPPKTSLAPSLIHGLAYQPAEAPAALKDSDPRVGPIKPTTRVLSKFGHDISAFRDDDLKSARAVIDSQFHSLPVPFAKILSLDEVINGVPGTTIDSFKMTSSAGRPWKSLGKGKSAIFVGEPGSRSATPAFEEAFNRRILNAKAGFSTYTPVELFMKDELRPIQKIADGKTRGIDNYPACFNAVVKAYTASYVNTFILGRSKTGSALGIDVSGPEWTELVYKFKNFSNKVYAGDFQCFDGIIPPDVIKQAIDHIKEWNRQNIPGWTQADDAVMDEIAERLISRVQFFFNLVMEVDQGNGSGNILTTVINILCLLMMFHCSACEITREVNGYPISPSDYDANVLIECYGDDNFFAVKDEFAHILTFQNFQKCFALHGIVYTPEDKSEGSKPARPIEEITFLKCGFRPDTDFPTLYHATMAKSTIYQLTNWVRKGLDPEEALRVNIETSFRFAYQHGETFFNDHVRKVNSALRHIGLQTFPALYSSYHQEWLSKFFFKS